MKTVLIIDDDRSFLTFVSNVLEKKGYNIIAKENYRDAKEIVQNRKADCIILDIQLKEENGYDVCRKIKEGEALPIIFISNHGEDEDRIEGFRAGGDDYMSKPCNPDELAFRVERRIHPSIKETKECIVSGKLEMMLEERKVVYDGEVLYLTDAEFDILCFLAQHKEQSFNHIEIYEHVWKEPSLNNAHTVQVHISSLRKKLNSVSKEHEYIRTVWGKGYHFYGC